MTSKIKTLGTAVELSTLLSVKDKLIVVDVFADWCGPCKQLGEVLRKWFDVENLFTTVAVVKISADNPEFDTFMENNNVSGIPRVFGFKNGVKVFDITGISQAKLKELAQHMDTHK